MDEITESNIAFSRTLYNLMRRKTGCPPVIAMELVPSHSGWYVEMTDGSFSLDSVDASDVWAAKCKCIVGWQAMKNENLCRMCGD